MEVLPEVEVWYALPALRRVLSQELKKRGLSQKAIAEILHLAPSAVSQYIQGKRGNSELPESIMKHLRTSADALADGADPRVELMKLTNELRESRAICEIHHQHADIPEKCSCCFD